MRFRDLYACSTCGLVYNASVNNGACQSIVSVRVTYGTSTVVTVVPVRCGGTIRPVTFKAPPKDELQLDIEDMPTQNHINRVVHDVLAYGPMDVTHAPMETMDPTIREALGGFTASECEDIFMFYAEIIRLPVDRRLEATPPAALSRLLCKVSPFYLSMRAPIDAKKRGDLVGCPSEIVGALAAMGDERAEKAMNEKFSKLDTV